MVCLNVQTNQCGKWPFCKREDDFDRPIQYILLSTVVICVSARSRSVNGGHNEMELGIIVPEHG